MERRRATDGRVTKRKAESQDITNERLSKRLESLNLERNVSPQLYATLHPATAPVNASTAQTEQDDTMQLDDTKDKVYIYNLAKEIEDIEAAEAESNKVVFLPDIEKHLLDTRIPASVLANKDGELAGLNRNQALVLYEIPRSLSVAEDKDGVRKAILETRERARARQREERGETALGGELPTITAPATMRFGKAAVPLANGDIDAEADMVAVEEEDTDVMDLD